MNSKQKTVWIMIILLLVLHQDNWYWDDATLVLGFMPIGLFYHVCLSLAATFVWLVAVTFCWPDDLKGTAARKRKGDA